MNSLPATSYKLQATRSGFTLIEVLVAVTVMMILAGIGGMYLNSLYGAKRAENAANQIIALLLTAQEKSTSQEENSRWGVYFDGPSGTIQSYTLYRVDEGLLGNTPPYIQDNVIRRVSLADGLKFTAPAANMSVTIIFERITGLPATPQTVRLADDRALDNPKTITVDALGRIESSDL